MQSDSDLPSAAASVFLVVAFADYTIRLLSTRLRQRLTFIPCELEGWHTDRRALDLDRVTHSSLLAGIDKARMAAGIDRVGILGFSFGGMIALDYATIFPSHVSRIVTVCSSPCWTTAYHNSRRRFQDANLSRDRAAILERNKTDFDRIRSSIPASQLFARYTQVQAPLYWYDPSFDEAVFWEGLSVNLDLVNHVDSQVYKEHDWTSRYSSLDIPVLAVFGHHDFATPYDAWEPYRSCFKHLTTRVFEKSSHHPMVEERDAFDDCILDWLAQGR